MSLKKILWGIKDDHKISNGVRHRFATVTPEEAKNSIFLFYQFAVVEGWTYMEAVGRIKQEMDNWERHGKLDKNSKELEDAIKKIQELTAKNQELSAKANEYLEMKSQVDVLNGQITLINRQLENEKLKAEKKDAKYDELRKQNYEKAQKFQADKKQLEEQLAKREAEGQYLDYLTRITAYTRTRHDFEKTIIQLSSEQEKILEQIKLNKDFLIKGSAGTGKSLVLLKTIEKVFNDAKNDMYSDGQLPKIKLLTYTHSLVKYNQYVSSLLNEDIDPDYISTADSCLYGVGRKLFPSHYMAFGLNDDFRDLFGTEEFTDKEAFDEAEQFIWGNCITKEEYLEKGIDRTGMKSPLTKKQRQKMWKHIAEVEEGLEERETWPRVYLIKRINDELDAISKEELDRLSWDYIFIDEAQDLPPVMLSMLKKLTRKAVYMAGDTDQSLYNNGISWIRSGINISGRTRILRTNFRNTAQIHQVAEEYRKTFPSKDTENKPAAFIPGPPVSFFVDNNKDALIEKIVEQVRLLKNALGYMDENICILTYEKSRFSKISNLLKKKLDLECASMMEKDFSFENSKGIRLCTINSSKGLDFPVVLVLADYEPHYDSAFDEDTMDIQTHNLLYVAMTRAMEMLCIFANGDSSSKAIRDLVEVQKTIQPS